MTARLPRVVALAPWLALFAFAAALTLQDIRSPDYWWHLRTGSLIAETGSVPQVDPYTYTAPGSPWTDIHWLFQLGLHGVHSLGGHSAVVVAKLGFVFALLLLLAPIGSRRHRPVVSVVALGLMLAIAADRFMPRPELPSFVLLAAVLALVDRFRRCGDRWIYAVVPLQILWVNVHGLFALGIAVCGIALAVEGFRWVRGERARGPRVVRLALATFLAAAASLANPNGLDGAIYPLQQLQMIGPPEMRGALGRVIIELTPLFDERRPLDPLAMALFLALAGSSAGALLLNRQRLGYDLLLWLAFLVLALGAQRNLALFAIVAAPILVRNTNDFLDARGGVAPGVRFAAATAASVVLCAVAVDAARGGFFERIGVYRSPGIGIMAIAQPVEAAEWIARERPPGPIAHDMADGGYFIWRLHPMYPVMVDGRLEVFGARRFTELMLSGVDGFRDLEAKYRFRVVVLRHASGEADALLRWLFLSSSWTLVHVDDLSAVFVRVPPGGTPVWQDIDLDAADLFPPVQDADAATERARFRSRTRFYMQMRRFARALAVWEEALARYPDIDSGRLQHAILLLQNGRIAEAEPLLVETVAREPDRAEARSYLADLRRAAGKLFEARTLYEAALELDPAQHRAALGLARVHEASGMPAAAISLYVRVITYAPAGDDVAREAAARLDALPGGRAARSRIGNAPR